MKLATLIIDGITYTYFDKNDGEIVVRVGENHNVSKNAYWDIDILTEDLYTEPNLTIVYIDESIIDYMMNEIAEMYIDDEFYDKAYERLSTYRKENL